VGWFFFPAYEEKNTYNAMRGKEGGWWWYEQGTVDTVATRYASMAVRMLETLRKTESSLKRLKKNRAVEPAADGSQLSDIDKISLQLFLDVEVETL
jgi:Domain of unknown function (DUF3510)